MMTKANTIKVSIALLATALLTTAVSAGAQTLLPRTQPTIVPIPRPRPVLLLPDLIVERFHLAWSAQGVPLIIITVKNQGNAASTWYSSLSFYVNNVPAPAYGATIPPLYPGESIELGTFYVNVNTLPVGDVYFYADGGRQILESNENNNSLSGHISERDWFSILF